MSNSTPVLVSVAHASKESEGNISGGSLMRIELYISLTLPLRLLCLRISRFEVPALLIPGDSAYLTCLYDLSGEKLYSVKWFKDQKEFYRYFPTLTPAFMAFAAPGIVVDLSRSGPSTVYLRNVTLETEGRFTCQVSADEPFFGCVQVHRDIAVYIPPENSPEISGGISNQGQNLSVRCSSSKSKPAANLSWFVNDIMMAPEDATSTHEVTHHQDQLESSSSRLELPLESPSLPPGDLRLSCTASISSIVTAVSRELVISRKDNGRPQQHTSPRLTAATSEAAIVDVMAKELLLAITFIVGLSLYAV